jgi:hypothetical protein
MAKSTIKVSIRKNYYGNKYGLGFTKLKTGTRFDAPYVSVSVFDGDTTGLGWKSIVRSAKSGVKFMYENNRTGVTRISHFL